MVLRPFGHHAERADVAVTSQRVFFIPTVTAIENKGQTIVRCTVTLRGLNYGVTYTFGVRAEDQSGNEDSNTGTLTVTPSAPVPDTSTRRYRYRPVNERRTR